MTLKYRLYGYETLGVFGHWEPFRNTRHYSVELSDEDVYRIERYGKVMLYDQPFRDSFTKVEISFVDLVNGVEAEGDCYARDNF